MFMRYQNRFLAALCILIFCIGVAGQHIDTTEASRVTSCEENEARLDQILFRWLKDSESENTLIVVGRLGSGETSARTNRYRLHNAREYLLRRHADKRSSILVAEGERRTGLGQVEFYLNGKLIDTLLVRKTRPLCVDCCENHQLPPFKDTWQSRWARGGRFLVV